MGIYKVQNNGKAESGLSIGDQVVTGGGTYIITGMDAGGNYQSTLVNPDQTTYNYKGAYDSKNKNKDRDALKADSSRNAALNYYLDMVNEAANSVYRPSSYINVAASQGADPMSFADALKLAEETLRPMYEQGSKQAAANANQRLERAGLYDTVYGQSLAASAETQAAEELATAVTSLALQLQKNGQDAINRLLEAMVSENQFAAEMDAKSLTNALHYLMELIVE